ncbi:MAG: tetratricopeptide repeat protein, partial [Actinomycetota bacterium]|nr:tetratricopeptide repeat protein [Actinomycetota bacterium]
TQERLAEALGYEVSYIAKIERGRRRPTEQFVARLAEVAAISTQELLQLCRRPTARLRLPLPHAPIVGRAREIAEVTELLRRGRCVTLVGAPGIGKTSLALEVGWHAVEEYRHGVCFVPLSEVSEPTSVTAAVVQRLGLTEQAGGNLDDLVVQALRTQALLLVLDNFEHVLEAAPLVERLLLDAPGVRVLATSREAMGLADEEEYPVRPLAFPDPCGELDDMERYPAVEVFVTRSRLVRPDFALNDENLRPVADICSRLDGLPLAITLTAAASKILSPFDIARSLGRRLELPVDAVAGRQVDRRLTAALDWSWDLLQPSQQALFARLGVFAGSYSLAAVESVCTGGADDEDLLADLAALESKSLVEAVASNIGVSRFMSLEPLRRYAEHRLRESGRLDELRERHCAYYVSLAEAAEPHLAGGRDQARSLCVLEEEYANLAAALEWSLLRQPATALRLAAALRRFFSMRRITEGRAWLAAALEAAPEPTLAYLKALNGFAVLALSQGDLDLAFTSLDEARELARELGAQSELALAILNYGNAADRRGSYDLAARCYEEANALYRQVRDERGVGHCLNGLGVIALHRNDNQCALELFLEALNRFRAVNDRSSVAVTATNLGWIAEMEDELGEARDWYEESRRIREGIGDAYACARSTADLGRITRRQGEPALAAELLEKALHVFHRTGDRRLAANYLVELAAVAAQQKRHHMAARLLGAAQSVRERLGTTAWPHEMALHDEVLAALLLRVDEGTVHRAVRMGRALSLEDAVELVNGGTWPPAYRRWAAPPAPDASSAIASSF